MRIDKGFNVRLSSLVLFLVAFTSQGVLIFAYWIERMRPNPYLTWTALSLSGVCVALMVALAIATRNVGTRWMSAGLIGGMALAFSALTILSIGILIAPFALALIILSVVMLMRNRTSLPANE